MTERLLRTALSMWLIGCASGGVPERTEVQVFAASSLGEAFAELERSFEASRQDVDVRLTLSGSQILRLQIEQGAVADVFASANPGHMQALVDQGLVASAGVFARNELVVIVPPDNPAGLRSFADLDRASRIVLGTDNVPVGIYARQALERARQPLGDAFVARVLERVASEESNVRLVRAKVELGEADAAIVYRTDAVGSQAVGVVPIPEAINPLVSYPIGVVGGAPHPTEAKAFAAYVLSAQGQAILIRHGFAAGVE